MTKTVYIEYDEENDIYYADMPMVYHMEAENSVLWYAGEEKRFRYSAEVKLLSDELLRIKLDSRVIVRDHMKPGDAICLELSGVKISLGRRIANVLSES